MSSLNIVFAGTPQFAARHLEALIASEHHIQAVYTQPDRPAGRGKKLTPSPVKSLALRHQLQVMQPPSLKSADAQKDLAAFGCDVMVVVAYGLILPQEVLDIPKHGCINVHASILPRWRGAAPIQRAIEAGDSYSGVTIMQMDAGLDTGDMLLKAECPISPRDTTTDLHDRLCEIGPPALLDALALVATGDYRGEKQDDSQSSYARKIEKSEALIDWEKSAETLDRQIRAFNPFPISYTTLKGERLKIYAAEPFPSVPQDSVPGQLHIINQQLVVTCGDGALAIKALQLPGKKSMDARAFINGAARQLDLSEPLILGQV